MLSSVSSEQSQVSDYIKMLISLGTGDSKCACGFNCILGFFKCENTHCLLLVHYIRMQESNYFRTHVLVSHFDLKVCMAKHALNPLQLACLLGDRRIGKVFKRKFAVLCWKSRSLPKSWCGSAENTTSRSKTKKKIKPFTILFTSPKARASPSLPSDRHWHKVCNTCFF